MPLRIVHGAARWPATPPLPPSTTASSLLLFATALGVRGPKRGRCQRHITTSIVHSTRLELALAGDMGLPLWRRRRSARAQGFFIGLLHEMVLLINRVLAVLPTASPRSAPLHAPPRMGHWDPPHAPTPAPRTASRTTVPPPRAAQRVVPCGMTPPQGEGRGLHFGRRGEPARRTSEALRSGAAGTMSSTPWRRCAGRSRLHAWSSISAMSFDCVHAPGGASSQGATLRTRSRMQDMPRTRRGVRPEDQGEGGREEHMIATIIRHLGIMVRILGSGVGVAERLLVPVFAATPTALRGGGGRAVGIAVAALRFVASFARTSISSKPSETTQPIIVGVLDRSLLACFARTSTMAGRSAAAAR